jgi:hypothetical protein
MRPGPVPIATRNRHTVAQGLLSRSAVNVRPSWRHRSGAAAVEMALVLPIFFTILFGIIEFGRAMMVSNLVTNAAREATRQAILDGSTNSSIETAAKTFLQQSLGVKATNVDFSIAITPAPGNTDPGGQLVNCQPRDLITVRIAIPFKSVSLLPPAVLGSRTMIGQSTMRHE